MEWVFFSGNSAAGSALRSGRRGRRFKSALPEIFSSGKLLAKHISKIAENKTMKLNVVLPIVGEVLKSPIVIGTTLAIILYLNFVFFVAHYKKKPPKPKKRHVVAPVPAKPKESESSDDSSGDAASEA